MYRWKLKEPTYLVDRVSVGGGRGTDETNKILLYCFGNVAVETVKVPTYLVDRVSVGGGRGTDETNKILLYCFGNVVSCCMARDFF